jgi:hypothetical protein
MDISFKTKEHPEARTVSYDFPADLEGLVAKFGNDSVYDNAVGSFVISLQALCRRHIEKSDEEIQEIVTNWDPNTRATGVRKTAAEKVSAALGQLSPEEKAALLAKLQASLGQ